MDIHKATVPVPTYCHHKRFNSTSELEILLDKKVGITEESIGSKGRATFPQASSDFTQS